MRKERKRRPVDSITDQKVVLERRLGGDKGREGAKEEKEGGEGESQGEGMREIQIERRNGVGERGKKRERDR